MARLIEIWDGVIYDARLEDVGHDNMKRIVVETWEGLYDKSSRMYKYGLKYERFVGMFDGGGNSENTLYATHCGQAVERQDAGNRIVGG